MTQRGTLYIIATPIGNLADISERALQTLQQVDLIAAEDTRHSKRLLQHFNINRSLFALHEHNEGQRSQALIERLLAGQSIALISDAGTPLISDPGYRLVHDARAAGITVAPVPGACALVAALSASGLPSDRFIFEGFLPAKSGARQQRLGELVDEVRTLIFYESPHRILASLQDMQTVFGAERYVVIARELTKTFETIHGDSLSQLLLWMSADNNQQRGEFVVLIHGAEAKPQSEVAMASTKLLEILLEELSVKQSAQIAAKITGEKKNHLYQLALQMKEQ